MLGTFITEWDEGSRVCGKIFTNKTIANAFANKLVGIAKHYGFDGYLVNIENPLSANQVRIPRTPPSTLPIAPLLCLVWCGRWLLVL